MLEEIRVRVVDTQRPRVWYIILDFRRVTGLDSSAVLTFAKGKQLAEAQGITLVLTQISERIRHQFELGGLSEEEERVRFFPDLDHGLEWCEEELLEVEGVTTSTASVMADSPVTAYRLTRTALSRMKSEQPELAVTFHEFVAHLLSERLAATTRTLEAVLR
jgi:hypothetical protein